MKIKTSWLLVLGVASSAALGVQASTMLRVQAETGSSVQAQQSVLQAQLPPAPVKTEPTQTTTRQATSGQAALCFTCGGRFPIFSGAFQSADGNPTEYAGGCSGNLEARPDSRPFLCTR